jgi:2-polyprenyl-3-methyl-5-hydroxy-6-metoxy-1,4-benzoquinol methylase
MLDVLCHRLTYLLSPQVDLYKNIAELVEPAHVTRVLDVGCGTGIGAVMMSRPHRLVQATDVDTTILAWVQDMWGHLIEVVPPGAVDGQFDLVTCIEVIEHADDPAGLVAYLRSRVRPGGLLVVSTVNHNSEYRKNNAHVAPFDVASFRRVMADHCEHGGLRISNFQLQLDLADTSPVTPMVAIWKRPLNG